MGLKEQEKVQLLLTSGLNPSSEEFHEALEGLNEAWESYFAELPKIIKYNEFNYDTRKFDGQEH